MRSIKLLQEAYTKVANRTNSFGKPWDNSVDNMFLSLYNYLKFEHYTDKGLNTGKKFYDAFLSELDKATGYDPKTATRPRRLDEYIYHFNHVLDHYCDFSTTWNLKSAKDIKRYGDVWYTDLIKRWLEKPHLFINDYNHWRKTYFLPLTKYANTTAKGSKDAGMNLDI